MTGKDKRTLKALASQMPSVVQIGKEGLSDAVIDSARPGYWSLWRVLQEEKRKVTLRFYYDVRL